MPSSQTEAQEISTAPNDSSAWKRTRPTLVQAMVLVAIAAIITLARTAFDPSARNLFAQPQLEADEVLLETAKAWTPPAVWIDARTKQAFERSHLPNAYHITLDDTENFEQLVFSVDKEGVFDGTRPVVVYCSSRACQLSQEVAARLRDHYPALKVFTLHGGWR